MEWSQIRSNAALRSRIALVMPTLVVTVLGLLLGGWVNLRVTEDILATRIIATRGGEATAFHLLDELFTYDLVYGGGLSLLALAGVLGWATARAGRRRPGPPGYGGPFGFPPSAGVLGWATTPAGQRYPGPMRKAAASRAPGGSPLAATRLLVFLSAMLLTPPLGGWFNLWGVRRLFLDQPGANHPVSQASYQAIVGQLDPLAAVYGQAVLATLIGITLMWGCWFAWSRLARPKLAARPS